MRDIKDYLYLYIGISCQFKAGNSMFTRKLEGSDLSHFIDEDYYEFIKPVLRPLSDMTTEEKKIATEKWTHESLSFDNEGRWFSPPLVVYLCKQGFDLFGLIEADLAINKTKL